MAALHEHYTQVCISTSALSEIPACLLAQLGADSGPAKALLALVDMVNQAVGDALSGVLLVEAALRRKKWGLPEWAALYTDLPSRQLKVSCCSSRAC